jgi:hypothetical protein
MNSHDSELLNETNAEIMWEGEHVRGDVYFNAQNGRPVIRQPWELTIQAYMISPSIRPMIIPACVADMDQHLGRLYT